ncbi:MULTISPECIES: hypothetical protein [unclassified Anabaena]|uniref:hypothetical protein n=1 Tax=unclassified Anabaena TaxID=2619674 RepID=UPI0006AC50FB|nr:MULTISPECIES: hypothetical protein [unclassified Anabaena]ALB41458.1 hypothetical protein AA650_14165 [Anabaena sp. WA102]ALB41459.1 hypothetical protein AA650_14170 [Anabaena sp. WA102]ALB41461.1 hypothetical protein AA650_14180 [Anabaena sp. WA102]
MLLDDVWWGVGDFYLFESGFPGYSGFTGCYWMMFGGGLVIFICLNQDFQDIQDLQDVIG